MKAKVIIFGIGAGLGLIGGLVLSIKLGATKSEVKI